MLAETYPLYPANKPHASNTDLEITDKYTGKVVTRVPLADTALIDRAIAAAAVGAGCRVGAVHQPPRASAH